MSCLVGQGFGRHLLKHYNGWHNMTIKGVLLLELHPIWTFTFVYVKIDKKNLDQFRAHLLILASDVRYQKNTLQLPEFQPEVFPLQKNAFNLQNFLQFDGRFFLHSESETYSRLASCQRGYVYDQRSIWSYRTAKSEFQYWVLGVIVRSYLLTKFRKTLCILNCIAWHI